MLWTAYLNNGSVPRGTDFVRAVTELAERAGVDPSPLDRPQRRDRRMDLLQDFFDLCRRELAGERGVDARAYLERRGFPREAIANSGLGVVPEPGKARRLLERAGYRPEEIAMAGILADSRWSGRLCGAWRDDYGSIGTLWARSPDSAAAADARYLYLRGASRTNLPPYGLSDLLAGPRDVWRGRSENRLFTAGNIRAKAAGALAGRSHRRSAPRRLRRCGRARQVSADMMA